MKRRKRPPSEGEVVESIFSRKVNVDGNSMSTREAMIRRLYNRSLCGDIDASLHLQKLRDDCGLKSDAKPAGCLVLPEQPSAEEYERRVFENQAYAREKNYGKGEF
jgi:hypothetical protein